MGDGGTLSTYNQTDLHSHDSPSKDYSHQSPERDNVEAESECKTVEREAYLTEQKRQDMKFFVDGLEEWEGKETIIQC